ncbi:MAG: polyprenyl synthetase family protein [Patescibacteria group bacterium]|nr:polyprenyl synthetase family protein [Patescibacteria group bacterium]
MKLEEFSEKFSKIYLKEISLTFLRLEKKLLKHAKELNVISRQLFKILRGGKKIRPFLVFSIYSIFSRKLKENDMLLEIADVLVAIELFHNFCLVHDDIMDNGKLRHNQKTINYFLWQKFSKRLNNNQQLIKFAEGQAIIFGDWLFKEVFASLDKHQWENDRIKKLFYKEFFEMIDLVLIGQAVDIYLTTKPRPTLSLILEKNLLKTSFYSFVKPMRIGYVLAGGREASLFKTIDYVGKHLGLIYQIQDDVFDILGEKKKTGKDILNDIFNNQHTFLTFYLNKYFRNDFLLLRDKLFDNQIDVQRFIKFVEESGVIEFARKKISENSNLIKNELKRINNQKFVDFINYLLDLILTREK